MEEPERVPDEEEIQRGVLRHHVAEPEPGVELAREQPLIDPQIGTADDREEAQPADRRHDRGEQLPERAQPPVLARARPPLHEGQ